MNIICQILLQDFSTRSLDMSEESSSRRPETRGLIKHVEIAEGENDDRTEDELLSFRPRRAWEIRYSDFSNIYSKSWSCFCIFSQQWKQVSQLKNNYVNKDFYWNSECRRPRWLFLKTYHSSRKKWLVTALYFYFVDSSEFFFNSFLVHIHICSSTQIDPLLHSLAFSLNGHLVTW